MSSSPESFHPKSAWYRLRDGWRELKQGRPGSRFADFYCKRRESEHSTLKKSLSLFAGAVLFLAGVLMLAAPGPGLLFMLLGAAMLAQYSWVVAKALDRIESTVRGLKR
ncbi:MAG TPA: PGPGW domain-containing protein [Burkholderiales bacterium]|nr:PGPGW domain-containing protein [Burkholderiales bacterium]